MQMLEILTAKRYGREEIQKFGILEERWLHQVLTQLWV